MYYIQSIIFNKYKNDIEKVISWVINHDFKVKKIDENPQSYRVRQINPDYLKSLGYNEFRTIDVDKKNGIQFIMAYKE